MEHEFTTCPECGIPAEISQRTMLPSTDGPVEHVKTRCLAGHWFFMEAAALRPLEPAEAGRSAAPRTGSRAGARRHQAGWLGFPGQRRLAP